MDPGPELAAEAAAGEAAAAAVAEVAAASFTIDGNAPVVSGTLAFDASLAVTGSYTQTSTGALRLFIGGHTAGVSYSQLQVGKAVDLNGTLEVVLQPDLFSLFNYDPKVGDTFDFVTGAGGITLEPSLQYEFFVTTADLSYFNGYDLASYSSGVTAQPACSTDLPRRTVRMAA